MYWSGHYSFIGFIIIFLIKYYVMSFIDTNTSNAHTLEINYLSTGHLVSVQHKD